MGPQTKRLRNAVYGSGGGGGRDELQWGRKQNACGIFLSISNTITSYMASMGPQTKRLRNLYAMDMFGMQLTCFNGAANKTLAEFGTIKSNSIIIFDGFNGAANKTLAESYGKYKNPNTKDVLQWGRKQNACGIWWWGLVLGKVTSFNGAANKTLAECC